MIKSSLNNCFRSTPTKIIFTSKPNFTNMRKDRLPTLSCKNVVYKFLCYCEGSYVGKTTQALRTRIKQHIPACLQKYIESVKNNTTQKFNKLSAVKNTATRSGISEHLINNIDCMRHYDISRFKPIAKARNDFHLGKLESVYITNLQPEFCRQSDFCYSLLLF